MNSSRDKTTMISESPEVCDHIAVRLNHYIIIIGGTLKIITSADSKQNHVIWRYNLYTEQWKKYLIPKTKQTPDLHYTDTEERTVTIGESVYMYLIDSSFKQDLWKLTQTAHHCYVWEKVLAKNGTKIPSPRDNLSSWEYSNQMWILGGFMLQLDGYLNDHDGEHSGGNVGPNNQLLKFNPVSKEWSNPKSSGTVPNYHRTHTTTAIGHKVWYSTGAFEELYELDMQSLIWTCIKVNPPHPQHHHSCSINALTEKQLVMHGRYAAKIGSLSDTWVLDLPLRSWKKYTSYKAHPRRGHTGSLGLNNDIIIIGGIRSHSFLQIFVNKAIFHVMFEPKCLQQVAMQTVFKHQAELPLTSLPKKLCKCMDIEIGCRSANISAEETFASVRSRRGTKKPK